MGSNRPLRAILCGLILCAAAALQSLRPPSLAAAEVAPPPTEDIAGAKTLAEAGRYAEAEALARRLLEQAERDHGPGSRQVAETLDLLVGVLMRARKAGVPEALVLARRAVAIKENLFGLEALEVGVSLGNLGTILRAQGQGVEAEKAAGRAVAIREVHLGPDHVDVARALSLLARVQIDGGKLADAGRSLDRAIAIFEQAGGPDYPDLDSALNSLGVLRATRGDAAGSLDIFRRVLAIREQALGIDHPEVARVTANLGVMLKTAGRFSEARSFLERTLAIDEAVHGPDHPAVAFDLFSLGLLGIDTRDLAAARPLLERSLAIRTRVFGEENPEVAASLHSLGEVHLLLGDDAEARARTEQALRIKEKTLGPAHFRVADSLEQLAFLDVRAGEFDQARSRYERALEILEASVGPESPAAAAALDGLGQALRKGGHPAEALPVHERALGIVEKSLGPGHPFSGTAAGNLALLLAEMGRYEEARVLQERAVAILEEAYAPPHPTIAWGLRGLALSLARTGDRDGALEAALRAESIGRDYQNLVTQALPERQALLLAADRPTTLDLILSLAAEAPADGSVAKRAWDALIRSRALVLDEMAARRRAIGTRGDAETQRLATEFLAASTRLANLLVKGAGDQRASVSRSAFDEAVAARDAAERALATRSAAYRIEQAGRGAGLQEVAAGRPDGSALVAYALYKGQHPAPAGASYLAFVLPPASQTPVVVPLGAAAEIDALVTGWRAQVMQGMSTAGVAGEEMVIEAAYRAAGADLRRRVWDPVAAHLGPAKRVFVVPDGSLNVVSIFTLPAGATEYLVERLPPLQYLSAERDFVSLAAVREHGDGLLVMGGPAYDALPVIAAGGSGSASGKAAGGASADAAVAFRGELSACAALRSMVFQPLPAAAGEAREVERLWKAGEAVRLVDAQATETMFKTTAPGRRVVHLATHGFFLGAECPSALAPVDGRGDNPLRLAGLALAGANRHGQAGPDRDDGILTAEEIAALDLSGVEWAVLSACDTGRGTVQAGEGVLGLRRAFQIAGARTVVLSLWPVEDRSARAWMRRLYQGRSARGLETAAAVREASLGLLQERRERERGTHPIHWGGFVAAGDWR